jgi:hypothetical protein
MRIPPSVIVMSLVVAVPFGLAIRETVNHDDPKSRAERELQKETEEMEAAQRAEEAEQAKLRAEEQKKQNERIAAVKGLFGQTPGSMGPALAGIELGHPPSADAVDRITALPFVVRLQRDTEDRVTSVRVKLGTGDYDSPDENGDECQRVKDYLTSSWGHDDNYNWHDAEQHQRVTFSNIGCEVHIEQYREPAEWLKLVPMNLVGKTLDQAVALPVLAWPEDRNDNAATWELPGLGRGTEPTKLQAIVIKRHIAVTIATTTIAAEDSEAFVTAATLAFHGKPHHEDGDSMYTWKRSPQIQLELDGSAMTLTIGTLPDSYNSLDEGM